MASSTEGRRSGGLFHSEVAYGNDGEELATSRSSEDGRQGEGGAAVLIPLSPQAKMNCGKVRLQFDS